MRREKRNQDRSDTNKVKNMVYLVGSVLGIAVVAFVITFAVYSGNHSGKSSDLDSGKIAELVPNTVQNTQAEEASMQMGKDVNEMKHETNTTNTVNTTKQTKKSEGTQQKNVTEDNKKTAPKTNTTKQTSAKEQNKEEQKDPSFAKPVEGDIIKEYAKDNLLFSQTLNEWITHTGIDIKAEKTTVVKAASDGKIKAIKNDPRYGLTIVVEHTNGFTSVYSNLLTAEFVKEGENVKQGQTIATVGNTATFEIADESHLHFEIWKDGTAVDPNAYIK